MFLIKQILTLKINSEKSLRTYGLNNKRNGDGYLDFCF
jgi:hypothetical protein